MTIITVDGLNFRVEFEPDHDAGSPWGREDGHGPVEECTYRDKRPGELFLAGRDPQCGMRTYYDFAEACRIAQRDDWGGWSATTGMTRKQFAAEKAREDFERLRAWVNDGWHYLGVVVTLLDVDGNDTDAVQSLWGIESDAGGYLDETGHELALNCIHDIRERLTFDNGTTYTSGARSWRISDEAI